ncbi:MAG: histidinol-phosphate transaminase [Oleispira sp.]|nr:histidinol-phosphate transaminase [Oleispira sp.]MBL4880688.1 histidinol-phosphate transaminase [Oleispira sp.]
MTDQRNSELCEKARAEIKSLRAYQPGKPIDELAREFGLNADDIVKLASNENPTGPSKKAIVAMEKEARELTRYPDGNGFDLKQALCQKLSKDSVAVKPENITLGNGSSDILDFIVKCFVAKGDEVVFSQHAFAIYGLVTKIQGGECKIVPAKNYGHDLDAMAAAISAKTRLVFITNPNNPTGTWLTQTEIADFMAKVPSDVVVVLDEAYFEYVSEAEYANGLTLISDNPNLVVTRTFSKAYGLASLRVGYGISSPEVADLMNRVRPPFNVNSFALAAAVAALGDDEYVAESKAVNDAGMAYLTRSFDQLGLPYIPSVGNFISFEIPPVVSAGVTGVSAAEVDKNLLAVGVIIRPIANYEMPNHLRVSIGTQAENETFIVALTKILADTRS